MCAEPKTAEDASENYWGKIGITEYGAVIAFAAKQKGLLTQAFVDGAQWERMQLRRFAAAMDAHAVAGERSE